MIVKKQVKGEGVRPREVDIPYLVTKSSMHTNRNPNPKTVFGRHVLITERQTPSLPEFIIEGHLKM